MTAEPVAPRLKALRESAPIRLSIRRVGKGMGKPHTTYAYYEDDYKEPYLPMAVANEIVAVFEEHGIPREKIYALAGVERAEEDGQNAAGARNRSVTTGMARIEELDVRGSAGGGAIVDDGDGRDPVHEWSIPAELIRSASYAPPDRIKIITVVGDSMEGTFRPFERVMVDTTDTVPTPPGIFVVYDGLGLVVKRVEYVPHSEPPTVRITSDNPRYSSYERILGEAYIQGRVLGRWQWV